VKRVNITEVISSGAYATAADFEQIFTQEMSALYLLSFLLTGGREKAEECFVNGIGESAKANRVFKEWARSWARRTIIQSAIRLIAPLQHSDRAMRSPSAVGTMDKLPIVSQAEVSAILDLSPLERFVFVMSALERYSDHECSILLGCARRDVIDARARALQHLGQLMGSQKSEPGIGPEDLAVRNNAMQVIEWTIARYFPVRSWSRANALSSA
jgi:DNA-directed RNA polymerase specialized sigma24 family protein